MLSVGESDSLWRGVTRFADLLHAQKWYITQ